MINMPSSYACIIYLILIGVRPTFTKLGSHTPSYVDTYKESLRIKSLPTGNVHTYFEFTTTDAKLSNHTRYVPRALSEILSHHSVEELHFTLTHGHWRSESWGETTSPATGGAQVVAWFASTENSDAIKNWRGLTSRLSGLTCASLNFLDDRNSIVPHFAYRPLGEMTKFVKPIHVRVGTLPKENVCTENLTPWIKLLPCGVVRGLASLLRSKQIFNTHYHSSGVHFIKTNIGVEFRFTLSLVFDPPKQSKFKPSDNFVRRIFGSLPAFPCHPSHETTITLWKNGTWSNVDVKDLSSLKISDIGEGKPSDINLIFTPLKYLGGYGQEYGTMIVEMTNHLAHQTLSTLYVEVLPWYIRPYLHTMSVRLMPTGEIVHLEDQLFHYTPGRDRERLHKLEMSLNVPPMSTVRVSFEVEKRNLRWDEYPPDANHGFYLEPSHFEVNYTSEDGQTKTLYYHSRKLLVNLSTPDFSMPYNVICLTCTVVALAFGPLHNITTKTLRLKPISPKKERLCQLWNKVKSVFIKSKPKEMEKTTDTLTTPTCTATASSPFPEEDSFLREDIKDGNGVEDVALFTAPKSDEPTAVPTLKKRKAKHVQN